MFLNLLHNSIRRVCSSKTLSTFLWKMEIVPGLGTIVVLNLWVVTLSPQKRPSENTDIYVMIHNSSKFAVMK